MTTNTFGSLKYFTLDEFDCKETGENKMTYDFLSLLDTLRENCGFPFKITSGYRSPKHSVEASKPSGSLRVHTLGIAADIAVFNGYQRHSVVQEALKLGFKGIGVAKGFVHVDTRESQAVLWTY